MKALIVLSAPTKRLYLRQSPRRRNNHSLERGFYNAEFSTGDDPINYTDLWGLECSATDKRIEELGTGTYHAINSGLKNELEERGWTYIGDDPKTREAIHNDLKEKALDPATSPYWEVSGRTEITPYFTPTAIGRSDTGKTITTGEHAIAEGYKYSIAPTSPQSKRPGPTIKTYFDANGDTHIDFEAEGWR
jgi:hypothetical protein